MASFKIHNLLCMILHYLVVDFRPYRLLTVQNGLFAFVIIVQIIIVGLIGDMNLNCLM